ncbi:hypothetical protein [Rhodohalobacter sp. 8-1]|uniref:hypothetical protein n=1 Tax=Rhodohalobacter sp. 8-1 TaxID=3131972 RepID=UPI0030EC0E19
MKPSLLPILLSSLFLVLSADPVYSQTSLKDIPPEKYFDFWIGEWNLTWEDPDGSTGTGVNKIERILNDAVIKENFEGLTGVYAGFIGKSYSVYQPASGEWKQTWVDNNGGYLDFTGKFVDNRRLFTRTGIDLNGNPIMQRMIFYDIREDSFTWDWEVSRDAGNTWTLNWRIKYERAK